MLALLRYGLLEGHSHLDEVLLKTWVLGHLTQDLFLASQPPLGPGQ